MVISKVSFAAPNEAQFSLGDKFSVFSDKAYRKNNGRYFEAVGNVVIISQQDTIYGELASLNQDTMMVKIEGNVRIVTKDLTLYGSHLEYNITTGYAVIKNARILSPDYNLVASELIRVSESEYVANEGEFTTCRDCAESWSLYGKVIRLKVNKYVQISHGLAKIKGVNVLYVPYIVLPILARRETGLLIPRISSRVGEGLSFEQPVFVAIDESKDMTISPTFWAKRGYGGDFQYRQRFRDLTWAELNTRMLNDTIYQPGGSDNEKSGKEYFRHFTELDSHQQWTSNLNSHVRYTGVRDLDIVRTMPQFTDNKVLSSDLGFQGNVNFRQDMFSLGTEGQYLRNQLYADSVDFDRGYVQIVPRATLATTPYSVVQSRLPFFQHITTGVGGSYSRFRQVDQNDEIYIRNADRFSVQPYVNWHFFTWGPVSLKSRYIFDQQSYMFAENDEPNFGKNAGLMRTEVSFTMDKIFGLAYEEKIPIKYISQKELKRLRENKTEGLTPIQQTKKENRLVGNMPPFESELSKEHITQVKNSYRHSQEFKFLHHFQASENTYGNDRFSQQIKSGQLGWFDYEDAIRAREFQSGSAITRTVIPPQNTLELQWNNTLIKKTPKRFTFLDDEKYLRDNFSYSRIGYFNVSQGYLLQEQDYADFRERLTRLMVQAGYSANRWSVGASEHYFHYTNDNIFSMSFNRRFDYLNLFSAFNYSSIKPSNLQTLSFGGQVRPTDVLGLAMVKDVDMLAHQDVRTLYSLDIMPHNNCWILNLNYLQSIVAQRYSFNIIFNFGDDSFDRYRNDYFAVKRL